jgi:hypothetical protein
MLNSLFSNICTSTTYTSKLKLLFFAKPLWNFCIIVILLNSCDYNSIQPEMNNAKLKTQTKWQVDIKSNTKTHKIYEYFYDTSSNMTLANSYENGKLDIISTFEYTADKFIENKEYLTPNGEHKSSEKIVNTTTKLQDNSKIVVKEVYAENGTLVSTTNITYDKNGNISNVKTTSNDISQVKSVDYSNVYANNGALTGRTIVQVGEMQGQTEIVQYWDYSVINALILRTFNKTSVKDSTLVKYSVMKFNPRISKMTSESIYDGKNNLIEKYIIDYIFYK